MRNRTLATSAFAVAALLIAGCTTELQHGLSEGEANDIIVLLHQKGIDARKEKEDSSGTGEPTWKVSAKKGESHKAWALLKEAELPKPRMQGLEIFNRGGLIPTP